jgi:hypothetical protein
MLPDLFAFGPARVRACRAWLTLAVLPLLCSCASPALYRPGDAPERAENQRDILDIYPGDVRKNPANYANVGVGWAGIILHTEAHYDLDGRIQAVTTFEHHFFGWQVDRQSGQKKLILSPRGEGIFRTEWTLRRNNPEAGVDAAEAYASPGKLAIVYGVPQKVEDGAVVLRYRYLRLFQPWEFTIHEFDFGRFGEPYHYLE